MGERRAEATFANRVKNERRGEERKLPSESVAKTKRFGRHHVNVGFLLVYAEHGGVHARLKHHGATQIFVHEIDICS
jgi:hypothetical protein